MLFLHRHSTEAYYICYYYFKKTQLVFVYTFFGALEVETKGFIEYKMLLCRTNVRRRICRASQKWLNCTCLWQREVLLMTLHKFNNTPHCTLPAACTLFFIVYCFVSVFVYLRMRRSIIRECLRRDFSREKNHRCVICRKRQIGICKCRVWKRQY